MTTDYNLNSHYSSNSKVEKPRRQAVVAGPANLPKAHLFNDRDATTRIKIINNDIYQNFKHEKNKDEINFSKAFIALIFGILTFLGIKKFLK